MYPYPFRYIVPESVEEACAWGQQDGMKFLAGGQSLIPLLNLHLAEVKGLIDLHPLARDMARIVQLANEVRLGALATHQAIASDRQLAERCALFSLAGAHIGHARVRRWGTIGGALGHGDPLAEWILVLTALGADLSVRSADGIEPRRIFMDRLLLGPMMPDLAPGDLITEIVVPLPAHATYGFAEMSRRAGDYALVAAAVQLRWHEQTGLLEGLTVALSGVADVPVTFPELSRAVEGHAPSADLWDFLQHEIMQAVDPVSDLFASGRYRRHLAGVTVRRALDMATGSSAMTGS